MDPTIDGERKEVVFFYGKLATLGWDPNVWKWAVGVKFFNYTTKDGRDSIINRNPGTTRTGNKWQRYLQIILVPSV